MPLCRLACADAFLGRGICSQRAFGRACDAVADAAKRRRPRLLPYDTAHPERVVADYIPGGGPVEIAVGFEAAATRWDDGFEREG